MEVGLMYITKKQSTHCKFISVAVGFSKLSINKKKSTYEITKTAISGDGALMN
jgi:hypothetical protein